MTTDPISRPWRRYPRFSVRGLIVLVLLIGRGVGWMVRGARIQREAVTAITRVGGSVQYDWEDAEGNIPGKPPWAPRWLADLIGIDYFGHVISVTLSRTEAGTVIEQVGLLDQVEMLMLNQTSVSDAGLPHLKGLTKLEHLYLGYSQVTDAGLFHLKGLTNLSALDLAGTQVTDSGLVHLKGLSNLTALSLIESTDVTGAGFVHLNGLTKLSIVNLRRTQFTDAGLGHLKALTNLTSPDLMDTRVTDAGLAHLKALTKLSQLVLVGTQVTDSGMNDLKRALPGLTIDHY
jgi:hypothetical protein